MSILLRTGALRSGPCRAPAASAALVSRGVTWFSVPACLGSSRVIRMPQSTPSAPSGQPCAAPAGSISAVCYQRGVSTPSAPRSTAAAVEVRNTCGPSHTATAPASVGAASSAGAIPPSGRPPAAARSPAPRRHRRTNQSPTRATPTPPRGGHGVADPLGEHRLGQHAVDGGDVGPPRLPDGRTDHGPPPTQPLLDPGALPVGHPGRLPGQKLRRRRPRWLVRSPAPSIPTSAGPAPPSPAAGFRGPPFPVPERTIRRVRTTRPRSEPPAHRRRRRAPTVLRGGSAHRRGVKPFVAVEDSQITDVGQDPST